MGGQSVLGTRQEHQQQQRWSQKFSLCSLPSWWCQSSPSHGIKEVVCQTVPQASAPSPLRSPPSSAPVTPYSSSTTAIPHSVPRGSHATRLLLMLEKETPAELPRVEMVTRSRWS